MCNVTVEMRERLWFLQLWTELHVTAEFSISNNLIPVVVVVVVFLFLIWEMD